ncbi:MAG: AAA family ATPase, partial [Nannocystaceae bacterium]
MRFERLELERFGHFEQLALDLPKKPGLVVIHGPNEAGKTTLLRAIHGLLFGIEERTPYGFRFDYRSLSVRADLRDAAGRLLTVRRRKRRKQSLLATVDDGETIRALDEEAFAAYLGGVDEALYRALFGFTQFDLQRGSEVLQTLGLAEVIGGGALGGSGERIREALSWLTEEAEALFKLRGKLPAINRTLDALRDARSELAEATLQQRGYLELTEGLARTRAEIEDVDAGLVARRRRRARIVALLAGFEDFHEARELDERLARAAREQPESVALAVDDAARIEAILGELALRRPQLAALEEDDARTTARLAQLADDPAILAEEAAVERLARRSERIAGLRRELPRARGELSRRRDTLAARAVELGAAAAPEQAALAELGARLDRWRAEVEAAASVTRERAAAQASLEVAQAALAAEAAPAGEDLTPLASELDGALAAQRELEALTRSQARLDAKIDVARARLAPPLPADVDLVRASPPSLATIREAHEADQELARRERAAVAAQAEAQAQRAAAQAELAVLIAAGGVPDPEALATLRARRDAKLTALVDAWERGEPFARVDLFHQGRGLELVTAAREAIERADLHADRMRDAAERIAKRVELERQVARHEAALREREVEATAIATARGAWDESWRALWARCSVAPRRPARMLEWCEELAALQRDVHERAQLAREGEELAARLREFTSRLRAALDRDEKHVSRDMLSDAARDRGAAMDPASRRRADADLAADAGFVDDPRGAEADDAPSPALTELAPRLRARISREHARQGRETSLRDQVARQEVAVTRARAAAGEAATRVADAAAQLRSRARALLPKLSHEEDSWRDLEAAAATLERLRALEELARERALVDREEARVREALADVEGFERELQATRARLGDAQPVDDPEVAVEQLARRLARAKSSATARAHARDQAEEGRRAQARARQAIAALEEELARRTAALPSSARAEGTLARVAQAAQERGRLIRRRDELERHLVRSLGAGDER